MSSAEVSLMPKSDESAVDAASLTPPPAPIPMPVRQMRTVGSMMVSAMSGFSLLGPAPMHHRAMVSAMDTKQLPR